MTTPSFQGPCYSIGEKETASSLADPSGGEEKKCRCEDGRGFRSSSLPHYRVEQTASILSPQEMTSHQSACATDPLVKARSSITISLEGAHDSTSLHCFSIRSMNHSVPIRIIQIVNEVSSEVRSTRTTHRHGSIARHPSKARGERREHLSRCIDRTPRTSRLPRSGYRAAARRNQIPSETHDPPHVRSSSPTIPEHSAHSCPLRLAHQGPLIRTSRCAYVSGSQQHARHA